MRVEVLGNCFFAQLEFVWSKSVFYRDTHKRWLHHSYTERNRTTLTGEIYIRKMLVLTEFGASVVAVMRDRANFAVVDSAGRLQRFLAPNRG